jgi:hypothetical protein
VLKAPTAYLQICKAENFGTEENSGLSLKVVESLRMKKSSQFIVAKEIKSGSFHPSEIPALTGAAGKIPLWLPWCLGKPHLCLSGAGGGADFARCKVRNAARCSRSRGH